MTTPQAETSKPKAEPRGPRGKKSLPPTNEQDAAIKALSTLTRKQLRMKLLTPGQVGALIIRNPRTMEADRRKQRAAKATGKNIDPTDPISIPYIPPTESEREVQYVAIDVYDYLNRRFANVDRSHLKRGGPPDPAMRGFQSWLSFADATQTWPFCILPDGRPVDMMEALSTDRLTGDPVRLNIREFSERLQHAASNSFSQHEKAEVGKGTVKPKEATKDRKIRWKKPSGPI